jgi:Protein of unknown function (DUF4236)
MGLNFRKSINLLFFRINFSKSGVGWSIAPIPGFIRYVRSSAGRRYWRFSLPGTGIYYETRRTPKK